MLTAWSRLKEILQTTPALLEQITEVEAEEKRAINKWSKKEILGHLIDSAVNNHQRFVRLQIDNNITLPKYKQDEWVAVQQYQSRDWSDVIQLWKLYNEHLLHLFSVIDFSTLNNSLSLGGSSYTLQFLIDDYVNHMEHHLVQVLADVK